MRSLIFLYAETALVTVQHDILNAIGGRQSVLLVLLDLSAAFDTVSHAELISTLQRLGIIGRALQWFTSYLTDREQYTQIGFSKSSYEPMWCGVPLGSVLGPILFTIYTKSLGSLFRSHNMTWGWTVQSIQQPVPSPDKRGGLASGRASGHKKFAPINLP